jgi:phosphohistidine phosphatase SixA
LIDTVLCSSAARARQTFELLISVISSTRIAWKSLTSFATRVPTPC